MTESTPAIHYMDKSTSALDAAFDLVNQNRLGIWDSVLVKTQTQGRGQMRRKWDSPAGNIYAAIRLPVTCPFNDSAASLAAGVLCAGALRMAGYAVGLKWPNDLVMKLPDGQYAKVGGILLEEKNSAMIAGIGINTTCAPPAEKLRRGAAIPAASLSEACSAGMLPEDLWSLLVKNILCFYNSRPAFSENWPKLANDLLIWLGSRVEITDGNECAKGIFVSVASGGAAILQTSRGLEEITSGSMRLRKE